MAKKCLFCGDKLEFGVCTRCYEYDKEESYSRGYNEGYRDGFEEGRCEERSRIMSDIENDFSISFEKRLEILRKLGLR